MDATHYGGKIEFNVHNYFGFMESKATYEYLLNQGGQKLPFVLTRSTATGSGQFAAHWGGDNASTWPFLKLSIPSMLMFNIYGVPHVGADICGFDQDTTDELCARWV